MPYSLNLSDPTPESQDFSAQSPGSTTSSRPVAIFFNGTGIHSITGPVPLIDIAKTYNSNPAGELESILNTITLTGKIIRPDITPQPQSGIKTIFNAVTGLTDLFAKCSTGHLKIQCDNTDMLNVSGVRVKDVSINRSEDNWVFSADYTIGLEYYEPAQSGGLYVQNTSDSWSIEPLDDYVYSSFTTNVNTKTEYHNPQLKPNPLPGGGAAGGGSSNLGGVGAGTALKIINVPQYRVSRRVSAVGLPISRPTTSSSVACISGQGNRSYLEAKKWVESKLAYTFEGTNVGNNVSGSSGLVHIMSTPSIANFKDTFLYNHVRSINFSITDGSYEINDTWLAMPTGIKYVEDYSVECSTDDRYVKTVRVQGNIKGLYISSFEVMKGSGGTGLPPTGAGYLNLTSGSGRLSGNLPGAGNLLDLDNTAGSQPTFSSNPYENASSGWIFDIKPYIYRRASLAVYNNRFDRNQNYISPATNPPPPPNNPVYCHESLLNIIPVSTTEGHDPRKGSISYSYEFNNKFNLISGVISENITLNETGPTDVFSEAFVIGRQLGPVIQSLGTKTSTRKDLTVEVVVVPPSSIAGLIMTNNQCPLFTGGSVYSHIEGIVQGLKPFGARAGSYFGNINRGEMPGQVYLSQDNHSWNPTEGRYSRSVSWVYQQCSTDKLYLDH
jgi:hypothetical protein